MNFNEKTLEFWWFDISKRMNFGENDQKKRQKSQKLKVSAAKVSALNNLDSQDFDIFTE